VCPAGAAEKVAALMQRGAAARTVAATLLNSESSRSHTVFVVNLELRSAPNEHGVRCVSRPRLTLVDLAGGPSQRLGTAIGSFFLQHPQ